MHTSRPDPDRALFDALINNDIELAERLINQGANIGILYEGTYTFNYCNINALYILATMNQWSLIKKGLRPDTKNLDVITLNDGRTVLWQAVYVQQYALASRLLDFGANPNVVGGQYAEYTLLWFAATLGRWSLVEKILKHEITNIDYCGYTKEFYRGRTALWFAREAGATHIEALLLSKGASRSIAAPRTMPSIKTLPPPGAPSLFPFIERQIRDPENYCIITPDEKKRVMKSFSENIILQKLSRKRDGISRSVIRAENNELYALGKTLGSSKHSTVKVVQQLSNSSIRLCKIYKNFERIAKKEKYNLELIEGKTVPLLQRIDYSKRLYKTYSIRDIVPGDALHTLIDRDLAEKSGVVFLNNFIERVQIAIQLATDLHLRFHQLNLLHRDIKPANVIYDSTRKVLQLIDYETVLKLWDFIEFKDTVCGTPAFMSPEVSNRSVGIFSKKSDIFALGKTYLCLLNSDCHCPDEAVQMRIETLIEEMTLADRHRRPDIEKVIADLHTILKMLTPTSTLSTSASSSSSSSLLSSSSSSSSSSSLLSSSSSSSSSSTSVGLESKEPKKEKEEHGEKRKDHDSDCEPISSIKRFKS